MHDCVLRDLAKHCSRRVMVVNDFIRASGEVGVSAITTELSEEAVGNNCTVCYWGFDFRPTFCEVSSARVKTELGKRYLDGKLSVSGRTPIQAPVEPNAVNRKDIRSLLPAPLKRLSIDADGDLVLPALDSLPVQANQTIRQAFKSLEKEFPQKAPVMQQPASGGTGGTGAGTGGGTGGRGRGVQDQGRDLRPPCNCSSVCGDKCG